MGTPLSTQPERAIFAAWPRLRERVPWIGLGDFPTPVEPLARLASELGRDGAPFFVKRDDRSSPIYGGNKVRTLEVLFARARAAGATRIWSTGAYGSNHALATVLHAPRAGLEPGVILFPQPSSRAAVENLERTLSARPLVRALPHWSLLPLGMAATRRADRRSKTESFLMVPGGATPEGALGYVSAGLELAQQVAAGLLPVPDTIVVGVGSTCTSAGLLVGMHAAAALGLGWRCAPRLVSVRVTPWPVTSAWRIVRLAMRTAALLEELTADPRLALDARRLSASLEVDGAQLGPGYGHATDAGHEAIALARAAADLEVDTTYGAKSLAGALARVRAGLRGPLVYWATKSTAPLPLVDPVALRAAPAPMRAWLGRVCAVEEGVRRDLPPA
jgi:D-cysteine desulfhydrase